VKFTLQLRDRQTGKTIFSQPTYENKAEAKFHFHLCFWQAPPEVLPILDIHPATKEELSSWEVHRQLWSV
jgi:hypothetical protein